MSDLTATFLRPGILLVYANIQKVNVCALVSQPTRIWTYDLYKTQGGDQIPKSKN